MPAYAFRLPAGTAGELSRTGATIQPEILDPTNTPLRFGEPVRMAAGRAAILNGSSVAADIYGFLARSYPTQSNTNTFGPAAPVGGQPGNVMRRGYMLVQLRAGTAAKRGAVFVRIANASASQPIGGVEAAADGVNTIQVPNCEFMGPADATGVTEIAYNI